MAHQMTVFLIDDIDGSKASETVAFALDGAHYEIDLSVGNARKLRKAVAEFLAHARQVQTAGMVGLRAPQGTRDKAASASGRRTPKSELIAIRAWAADNHVQIGARGRISETLKEQYAAANAGA